MGPEAGRQRKFKDEILFLKEKVKNKEKCGVLIIEGNVVSILSFVTENQGSHFFTDTAFLEYR